MPFPVTSGNSIAPVLLVLPPVVLASTRASVYCMQLCFFGLLGHHAGRIMRAHAATVLEEE
jgi:hypothetical protein